jgi:hypothetical protein
MQAIAGSQRRCYGRASLSLFTDAHRSLCLRTRIALSVYRRASLSNARRSLWPAFRCPFTGSGRGPAPLHWRGQKLPGPPRSAPGCPGLSPTRSVDDGSDRNPKNRLREVKRSTGGPQTAPSCARYAALPGADGFHSHPPPVCTRPVDVCKQGQLC